MQQLKKNLPNILIIVFLAFGMFASAGSAFALASGSHDQGDGTPFIQLSPGEGATGLNPDDVWLTWANYEADEFWKYSYCIATQAAYDDGACQQGDPAWTGTYDRLYVHLTNLQPSTIYVWRVKVVQCKVKDCTEKNHIVSHSNFFTFTTGTDNWLKISGKAGDSSGILVNFYDDGTNSRLPERTYSITTGSNGKYTISVPFGFTGVAYPRKNPSEWTYENPLYDARFKPSYRYYTDVEQNLTDQDFVYAGDQVSVSGKTDGVPGVQIDLTYTGKFFDEAGDEIVFGDDGWDELQAAYCFTTVSDSDGDYKVNVPKNWIGTIQINEDWYGDNPYNASKTINYENFSPMYFSVPQLTGDKSGLNFYLDFVMISGYTSDLPGVEVTYEGDYHYSDGVAQEYDGVATSNSSGYYYFWVPKGWYGTFSPEMPFTHNGKTYNFEPSTYSFSQLYNNTSGWKFYKHEVP